MKTYLKVPYAEKDEAKRLGARWDSVRKSWYAENQPDLAPFMRWIPSSDVQQWLTKSDSGNGAQKATPKVSSSGVFVVGENYVEQQQVCCCLPWEVCEKCSSTAL